MMTKTSATLARVWAAVVAIAQGGMRTAKTIADRPNGLLGPLVRVVGFFARLPPPRVGTLQGGLGNAGSEVGRPFPARKLSETLETPPTPVLSMTLQSATPLLRGAEAYAWAWLRHGPLLPYLRAGTLDIYAADRYPRGSVGWVHGRLTMRAGAWWAWHASPEELSVVEYDAILAAPGHLVPSDCPVCHGIGTATAPCGQCFGTGLVHAFQPQPLYRPLP